MKKISIFVFIMLLFVSLVACSNQNNDEYVTTTALSSANNEKSDVLNELTEDLISTSKTVENVGGDDPECNHKYCYHTIDGCFSTYVEEHAPGWFDKFVDMFGRTEDCNIGFFTDYFGIPKEDFWTIVGSKASDFGIDYADFYNTDRWYADDYATNEYFLADDNPAPDSGSVMIRPEGDTIHTDRYFTIHKSLIDLVGEENFNEFREAYAGTADFNVLNFIDYFDISEESFTECMEEVKKTSLYIYNVNYVYGTEAEQKMYFEKHIIED